MRVFNNETELLDNEYLLKLSGGKGFLTKLNKTNNLPPKNFLTWGVKRKHIAGDYVVVEDPTIEIVEQNLCKGWKIGDYRRGESADWTVVIHPQGYSLEIKTKDFMELIPKVDIQKGIIAQALRWDREILKLD
jgi:hypothetical protein